jgi:hypothetical protein
MLSVLSAIVSHLTPHNLIMFKAFYQKCSIIAPFDLFGVMYETMAERIRLHQTVIMSWPSPKEGKLTSYFQNLQRKKGKPEEGCPT